MRILGHRGASADHPENTLPAFLAAMAQGSDGVELDVMRCGSGEVVVCHDEWLDRLAGRHWEVARTPWWKLQQADVGRPLGFPTARIPLLAEVLEALPATAIVNVELKCEDLDDRGLAVETARLVKVHGRKGSAFFSSFNPLCLVRLAQVWPEARRGYLLDPDRAWWRQAYLWAPLVARTSVHPHFSACTSDRVARWHAQGWEVATWTVDAGAQARALEAMGVDWLITNRPGAMRAELGRRD